MHIITLWNKKIHNLQLDGVDTYLESQKLGDRSNQIFEFKVSLIHRVSSGLAIAAQKNCVRKINGRKKERKSQFAITHPFLLIKTCQKFYFQCVKCHNIINEEHEK